MSRPLDVLTAALNKVVILKVRGHREIRGILRSYDPHLNLYLEDAEMIHPPNTTRAGEEYRIVVYKARLCGLPKDLPKEEIQGVIALTAAQVIRGLERRPTLAELVEEGASLVAGGETVGRGVRLYPIGTAMALAHILHHAMKEG